MASKEYVNLCLVKTKNNDIAPVVLPSTVCLSVGDLVFVPTALSEQPAEVVFHSNYTTVDDDLWTALILATGMAPIRAKKYAYMYEAEWEDKDGVHEKKECV